MKEILSFYLGMSFLLMLGMCYLAFKIYELFKGFIDEFRNELKKDINQ